MSLRKLIINKVYESFGSSIVFKIQIGIEQVMKGCIIFFSSKQVS